jgi:hypothetical protein
MRLVGFEQMRQEIMEYTGPYRICLCLAGIALIAGLLLGMAALAQLSDDSRIQRPVIGRKPECQF